MDQTEFNERRGELYAEMFNDSLVGVADNMIKDPRSRELFVKVISAALRGGASIKDVVSFMALMTKVDP